MSRFLRPLYAIMRLDAASEKVASEADVAAAKERLWQQMKLAAASDGGGRTLGLAKLAREIYHATRMTAPHVKVAADDEVTACILAASFASALAVDEAVEKQAQDGALSSGDAVKLQRINAISALADLDRLVKHAAPEWLTHAGIGAGAVGALGAGLGAWSDEENRVRGAIMGGLGGAAVGGLGGALYSHVGDALKAEEQQVGRDAASEARALESQSQGNIKFQQGQEDRKADAAKRLSDAAEAAQTAQVAESMANTGAANFGEGRFNRLRGSVENHATHLDKQIAEITEHPAFRAVEAEQTADPIGFLADHPVPEIRAVRQAFRQKVQQADGLKAQRATAKGLINRLDTHKDAFSQHLMDPKMPPTSIPATIMGEFPDPADHKLLHQIYSTYNKS